MSLVLLSFKAVFALVLFVLGVCFAALSAEEGRKKEAFGLFVFYLFAAILMVF